MPYYNSPRFRIMHFHKYRSEHNISKKIPILVVDALLCNKWLFGWQSLGKVGVRVRKDPYYDTAILICINATANLYIH